MAAIGAMTAVPAAAQAASVSSDSAAVSQAAPETKTTDKKDTSSLVSKWFTDDKGRIFYYDKDGKPLTGEQVIDGSYYLFSANGVQKTGWREREPGFPAFRLLPAPKYSPAPSKKR